MYPEQIYYEPAALDYPLGKALRERYSNAPWIPIESHNKIDELRTRPNSDFARMKRYLVVGVRKTHKYVPNHKVSDFLVPYTSSGCSAMCLYCYLVCNYNKCSYLRLFVNREEMLRKLMKTALNADRDLTFEIGSNSDLILENTITGNLPWTIEQFAKLEKGFLTFPTKFDSVDSLLTLDHRGRVIARMSVNPQEIISKVEFGTSPLFNRIAAVNRLGEAGYRVGLLIAPVILLENWELLYRELLDILEERLSPAVKKSMFIEIIFMTYSYVQNAINTEAFPNAVQLFHKGQMTGRGRGKYCYTAPLRASGEQFLRQEIGRRFGKNKILYIV
ncbi:SPL family radical SAM protein [Caproiciproducens galactitolivorans]|uniref:Spore photoproduct lyase n=1 Tax=Caproiciproducens galactitolivorans TaxID=642589 RepID=A0A4Z0Y0V7_9FIRM|nr:spore photoproduct lyase [Caproiciproducens galactitolivorans]TGJ77509.1 spore photoproduct lyase [Caproiciproducens galactitolivorans]